MAKRKAAIGGMNLDSLMDTLTNVVGILVIILIFAILGGSDAVKRIKNFVDEITDDQLADTLLEHQELRLLVDKQRDQLRDFETRAPEAQLSLERQRELAKQLKADLDKLAAAQIDPAELAKQVEERKNRVSELEQRVEEQEKLLASLKARLADNLADGPDKNAKIVNLPDPREAPKGATAVTFLCRDGRVVPLDVPGLQAKAQEVVKGAQRVLFRQDRIDCDKLVDLFEKRFVGDRYCQVKVRIGGDAKPYLTVFPRDNVGEKTGDIGRGTSLFNRWVKELNPQKQFIDFRVWGDSFDTYLEARNAAARRGVLAGWIPYQEKAEYWIGFGIDFKTICLGKNPPPPPPPSKPGDPTKPPPPADVVD